MLARRNNKEFHEIVTTRFGRKIAYTDFDVVDDNNILTIMSKSTGIFNTNRTEAEYLWNYKNGDQPVLYRDKLIRDDVINKVVENHAWEFVQFGVTQTYGEPIQYVSTKKDDTINDSVDKFNTFMKLANKFVRNASQGEWKVATGTSFLAIRQTGNEYRPIGISVPTPLNTWIVYSAKTDEPLVAFQQLKDTEGKLYYLAFSDNKEFVIKNGKLIKSQLHAFGGIPIVEIPNNQDRISDIELVISILDAINNMQSNRMDGVEQFIQSWFKFVNCAVDEETFGMMKKNGALVVNTTNKEAPADVDIMTQELNQTESQVAKEDLLDNALSILAIPNKQGGTGGDSQGAVELRNGWDFSKGRAKIKDSYIIEGELRFAEVALNVLRISGNDLHLNVGDFDVQINHSPTDNMVVKAQSLQYLLQVGIHPLIAIKTCGLWGDSEKTYLMSKPYLDVLYKAIDEGIDGISVDVQKETAIAETFTKFVNAGFSPSESAKRLGISEDTINASPSMAKWSYE